MKKLLVLVLAILVVMSTFALAKANDKEHQNNGNPFDEIWDYLEDFQGTIDSFFDVFVTIEDFQGTIDSFFDVFVTIETYEEDKDDLQSQIDELNERLDACNCGVEPEICDGIDNDGDGEIDEDFPDLYQSCDGDDLDLCPMGVTVCSLDGLGTECIDDIPSFTEICDGIDNDCDGEIDEGDVCEPVDCDDGNPCTIDSYNQQSQSCVNIPDVSASCDDGDACTENDMCDVEGNCLGGASVDCNDANPCTTDVCDSGSGCQNIANNEPCDDGIDCTINDVCTGGSCVSTPDHGSCYDGNPCTDDVCDLILGCQFPSNTDPCDDGNACTEQDVCDGTGNCIGGTPISCDDDDICTSDSCNPSVGCTWDILVGLPCEDEDACTVGDTCDVSGVCIGGPYPCPEGETCLEILGAPVCMPI